MLPTKVVAGEVTVGGATVTQADLKCPMRSVIWLRCEEARECPRNWLGRAWGCRSAWGSPRAGMGPR